MAPSQKRFLISLLPALLLALAAAACGREDARGKNLVPAQEPRGAAPAVTVAQVGVEDVAPGQSFIGHVIAIQAVQVVPRVTAFIDDVPVKQGSDVKAGQVLYELQKEQYRAAVEAARAQLASATREALGQNPRSIRRRQRAIRIRQMSKRRRPIWIRPSLI
jgi:membrane fusion protein (multidrug efflux system)